MTLPNRQPYPLPDWVVRVQFESCDDPNCNNISSVVLSSRRDVMRLPLYPCESWDSEDWPSILDHAVRAFERCYLTQPEDVWPSE